MKITSQAPTRIGLIGGGTDLNPFAAEYGGKTLSLAISLRHKVVLEPRKDTTIVISALGGTLELPLDKKCVYGEENKYNLVKAIINHFHDQIPTGFNLDVIFSGLSTSGLGTSSSVAVAVIGAFCTWLKIPLSRYEVAMLAWELENTELGWTSGKQDQLAAAFGGINLFYFGPGNKIGVEPLPLPKAQLDMLRNWSLLCFLGSTRSSGQIQKQLVKDMSYFVKQKALFALKDSVDEAYHYLLKADLIKLGEVLDEVWENKKTANPAATNEFIDKVYQIAKDNGALGGKVMGAGAGGHMYFVAPPETHEQIKTQFESLGVTLVPFRFEFDGLRTESSL